jgi:hypothetical protein
MKKKIIVRIAEGLGNQLFMYANAYCFALKNKFNLLIDDESGFFKKKNRNRNRHYLLKFFLIKQNLPSNKFKFNNYFKDIIRKFLKIINKFKKKKIFIIEINSKDKITKFTNISNISIGNTCYIEGHYESEKYFLEYSDKIKSQFIIKNKYINSNNIFISKLKKTNSISIHVRKHRFTEEQNEKKKYNKIIQSNLFEEKLIDYVNHGITFFKKKTSNPIFFLWSNDFEGLDKFFSKEVIFIKNQSLIDDFHLFQFCKHFIVGPSTFHWWGAWLNTTPGKICLRPKDNLLNPSNNKDFWPESWIKI